MMLQRAQIVAAASTDKEASEIADLVGCARSHVYRTVDHYLAQGWEGLLDGRRHNGSRKADEAFCDTVKELVDQSPRDYGYVRPTWTRELLVVVAEEQTGVHVSVTVMGRVLRKIGARRGRPKPVVACPLSKRQRRRRVRKIEQLLANLPPGEVAVYEDEVDIHLNPKVGLDWMNRGTQKTLMTPGKNQKAYLAGALDARDGTLTWVGGVTKDSDLFIAMLEKLDRRYPQAKCIHVILDNYGIHKSHKTRSALQQMPRIVLHFLPPYCPDHNRIERVWLDLHANVTRNHKHTELAPLCVEVVQHLEYRSVCPIEDLPLLDLAA